MLPEEALAQFVSLETPSRVDALAEGLRSGEITARSSLTVLGYRLPAGVRTVERASALLRAWEGDEATLAAALRGAAQVRARTEERGPTCELAWTGPRAEHGVRTTAQVVDEMLRRASREVVVVQYAVTTHAGVLSVFERLGRLSSNGVRVTWILDGRWKGGMSVTSVRTMWPKGSPAPRIWSYVVEDDELAKLHAKVLIVDDRDLFVTSANLTGYGYGVNLEFGVRVQGEPAIRASQHFDLLVSRGLLTEVPRSFE